MRFAGRLRSVCSLAALLLTAGPGVASSNRPAIAGAYALGGFSVSYGLSADVSLPEIATNRSWYADWIMLVAKREAGTRQPFVQLGEIRGFAPHDPPTAFIAYEAPGRPVVFRRLRPLPGEHHVAISGNERTIRLAFDQELLATFSRAQFFGPTDRVYAQYAAEVSDPGDIASGSLRRLAVETDGDFAPARSTFPACATIADSVWSERRTAFSRAGVFIPAIPAASETAPRFKNSPDPRCRDYGRC